MVRRQRQAVERRVVILHHRQRVTVVQGDGWHRAAAGAQFVRRRGAAGRAVRVRPLAARVRDGRIALEHRVVHRRLAARRPVLVRVDRRRHGRGADVQLRVISDRLRRHGPRHAAVERAAVVAGVVRQRVVVAEVVVDGGGGRRQLLVAVPPDRRRQLSGGRHLQVLAVVRRKHRRRLRRRHCRPVRRANCVF